jgi:hypothetical protein
MARQILGFNETEEITIEICRKKYRKLALKYHPDKNESKDASLEFIKINDAYRLLVNEEEGDNEEVDYKSLFFSFLQTVLGSHSNNEINEILFAIITKMSFLCRNVSREDIIPIMKKLVENIDKRVLVKIHAIVNKYRDVFHITEFISQLLEEIIREKQGKELESPCIILHPFLDDLFDEKLYKLVLRNESRNEETYIVPLWHHECIYDENICVKCIPILPQNIHIDNNNNIIVYLKFTPSEIFGLEKIQLELGEHLFYIAVSSLRIQKAQIYKIRGKGIPIINTVDIFDVSIKGDIIVHIMVN